MESFFLRGEGDKEGRKIHSVILASFVGAHTRFKNCGGGDLELGRLGTKAMLVWKGRKRNIG